MYCFSFSYKNKMATLVVFVYACCALIGELKNTLKSVLTSPGEIMFRSNLLRAHICNNNGTVAKTEI